MHKLVCGLFVINEIIFHLPLSKFCFTQNNGWHISGFRTWESNPSDNVLVYILQLTWIQVRYIIYIQEVYNFWTIFVTTAQTAPQLYKSILNTETGLHDGGSIPGRFWNVFLLTTASRTVLGPTQPSIQRLSGALSLGVKRPEREVDHSPPSSAEVKNTWSYTSTPQYAFMAWCSVKESTGSTLTLTFTFHLYKCENMYLRNTLGYIVQECVTVGSTVPMSKNACC
jgi:hypothetical protein